ncbi:MAG: FecR family protein [Massilibacteroides sp.]|nr:FecR family protein [Massilibacteroides sp.]MDD4115823.1 FecR family protein [Massilibacteroides sp.]MDD4660913.1 FecR family protein [Massilibacteroides sp.]
MDREVLHRFFLNIASFEEEEAVCDWADISDQNKRELLKERKYFDLVLLKNDGNNSGEIGKRPVVLFSRIGAVLKIVASIAVIVVSSFYLYNQVVKTTAEVALNKIVVPPGQRVNVILSDGTNVWLNACTELAYPVSFTRKERSVTLKGEAYFDVVKDEKHPFIVKTSKCDVKVLGTKFNIQVDGINSEFVASLLEGSIQLTNRMRSQPDLILSPMQKAEWSDGAFVVDSIRDLDSFRWKEGLVCFENIRFEDLMKRFERIYDMRIILQKDDLKEYRCSGKCRVADGIDYILKVLQRNKQFEFSRNDDNAIIYIK